MEIKHKVNEKKLLALKFVVLICDHYEPSSHFKGENVVGFT